MSMQAGWRAALLGACLGACSGGGNGALAQTVPQAPTNDINAVQGVLRLRGSSALGSELVPALAMAFGRASGLSGVRTVQDSETQSTTLVMEGGETERTLRVEILPTNSAAAFPALVDHSADVGMVSRAATEAERAALQKAGVGDIAAPGNVTPVSLDGIAVLVHPSNPVSRLTLPQLRAVFGKTVTNWSALGGPDLPISLYGSAQESGTLDMFRSLALGGGPVASSIHAGETGADVADAVASDPGGIGFTGLAYIRNAKPVALRLECGLERAPTRFLVRAEEYPLSRRLVLYSPAHKTAVAQAFLRFAASDAAAPVVEKAGFTSFTPEIADASDRAARVQGFALGTPDGRDARAKAAEFGAMTEGWRRVSTTFRFDFGGSALDARARDDLGRLAAWLKRDPKRQFMLVGYASGQGAFGANLTLSMRRAQEVGTQLAGRGAVPARVSGMGTMGPVGCNDMNTKGGINRRVEVWVR